MQISDTYYNHKSSVRQLAKQMRFVHFHPMQEMYVCQLLALGKWLLTSSDIPQGCGL